MKKQNLIIIGSILFVVVVFIIVKRMRNKKANNPTTNNIIIPQGINPTGEAIPKEVLREPAEDWIGETLTVDNQSYTPINGVWTRIK